MPRGFVGKPRRSVERRRNSYNPGTQKSPIAVPGKQAPTKQHVPACVQSALPPHVTPSPPQSMHEAMSSPASHMPFMLQVPPPPPPQSFAHVAEVSPFCASHTPSLSQPITGQSPQGGCMPISPASQVPLLLQTLPPPQSAGQFAASLATQMPSPQTALGASCCTRASTTGAGSFEPVPQPALANASVATISANPVPNTDVRGITLMSAPIVLRSTCK